ncbi:MAG: hypothetical protein JNM17_30830 [Archangium sp.]|nr:hypothetical protein [Archangium sp.]
MDELAPHAKSNRRPWLRGGLFGPVPLLLPLVWVVELNSCGGSTQTTEFSGLELLAKFDAEFWALFLPFLSISIAMPLFAARLIVPLHRMLFHVIGFVAALFTGYLAFMVLFFAIFTERRAQGAGWLVLALFTGACVDALYRLFWSVQEWRETRKAPS